MPKRPSTSRHFRALRVLVAGWATLCAACSSNANPAFESTSPGLDNLVPVHDAGLGSPDDAEPGFYDDGGIDIAKAADTPDYLQTSTAYGGFPGGGVDYCAPTSISDALVWLSENGFPNLVHDAGSPAASQYQLISTLGSPDYLNTAPDAGTTADNACRGLRNYIAGSGYDEPTVTWTGWGGGENCVAGTKHPTIESIQQGILGTGSVWLSIGWYTYDATTNTWTRTGGHVVNVVGYGYDGKEENPQALVFHDPATTAFDDYGVLVPLDGGTLAGADQPALPVNAAGYFRVMGSDYYPSKGAIVDGALFLSMP